MADEPKPLQPAKLWEKFPGESSLDYSRFLVYRNLGPGRTLNLAYAAYDASTRVAERRAKKGKQNHRTQPSPIVNVAGVRASGDWYKASAEYNWPERATEWDVEMLQRSGKETVAYFLAAVTKATGRILDALNEPGMKPAKFDEVLKGLYAISTFIPPATIGAVLNNSRSSGLDGNDEPAS